jgi:DNA-directed RNA polymerase subunit M/transcription elongation factor TFIIS
MSNYTNYTQNSNIVTPVFNFVIQAPVVTEKVITPFDIFSNFKIDDFRLSNDYVSKFGNKFSVLPMTKIYMLLGELETIYTNYRDNVNELFRHFDELLAKDIGYYYVNNNYTSLNKADINNKIEVQLSQEISIGIEGIGKCIYKDCGHNKLTFEILQTRSSDELAKTAIKCPKCGRSWSG